MKVDGPAGHGKDRTRSRSRTCARQWRTRPGRRQRRSDEGPFVARLDLREMMRQMARHMHDHAPAGETLLVLLTFTAIRKEHE